MTNKALVEALREAQSMLRRFARGYPSEVGPTLAKIDTALASSGNAPGDDKGLVERIVVDLSDRLISRMDLDEDDPRLSMIMDELRDRLTALSSGNEVAKVVGWQPIETAPKDGTEVDLWGGSDAGERAARAPDCQWRRGGWYSRGDKGWESLAGISWAPTHWMPRPAPPASAAAPLTGASA